MAELSDNILLDRLRKGSSEAYEEIFLRYWKPCFSTAFRKTGDKQEALDIVQDLFIYLWERRVDLPQDLHFSAYLTQAIKNRVINWSRRRQKEEVRREQWAVGSPSNDSEDSRPPVLFAELKREWSSAIDMLPERMKEIYLLRYGQELSITEISRQLNLRPQSVKNQLTHAVQRVRRQLAHHLDLILLTFALLPFFASFHFVRIPVLMIW